MAYLFEKHWGGGYREVLVSYARKLIARGIRPSPLYLVSPVPGKLNLSTEPGDNSLLEIKG